MSSPRMRRSLAGIPARKCADDGMEARSMKSGLALLAGLLFVEPSLARKSGFQKSRTSFFRSQASDWKPRVEATACRRYSSRLCESHFVLVAVFLIEASAEQGLFSLSRQLIPHSGIAACKVKLEEPERDEFAVNGGELGGLNRRDFGHARNPTVKLGRPFARLSLQVVIDLQRCPPIGMPPQLFEVKVVQHARWYRPDFDAPASTSQLARTTTPRRMTSQVRATGIFGRVTTGNVRRSPCTSNSPLKNVG